MKDQAEYTDADRLYGVWLAAKDRIQSIDHHVAEEAYPGEREDLVLERDDVACQYRKLTGNAPT